MKIKAIVLHSGGIDSTTTLAYALSKGYEVIALSFDYSQKHKKELQAAKKIANYYKVKHIIVKLYYPKEFSALTDNTKHIPQRTISDILLEKEIPATYVPARNIIFLSYAVAYCEFYNISDIFIGANVIDYSGYPDCKPQFLKKFELAINQGTKLKNYKIHYPLINKSKCEIIKLGMKLRAPYELTWSCYKGGKKPCQRCDACKLREKGFREAGLKPI